MEHVTSLRVRYGETDPQGVVHHPHFFDYFEIGRTEFLRACGVAYADLEKRGCFLVVTKAACRYRGNAGYDAVLRIATRVTAATPVRISFATTVTREPGGPVLAEGETTLACLDGEGRPRRLPPGLAAKLIG